MYLNGWKVRREKSSPSEISPFVYTNKAETETASLPKCSNDQPAGSTGHLQPTGVIK